MEYDSRHSVRNLCVQYGPNELYKKYEPPYYKFNVLVTWILIHVEACFGKFTSEGRWPRSRDSAFGVVARLRSGVRGSAGERDFYLLQNVQTSSGDHPASYSVGTGLLSRG